MNFGKADRQTITSYTPPMHRRVDSDRRTSLGWWGAVGDLAGFTLLEFLASPVLGIAVLVVSFCLVALEAMSDFFSYAIDALGSKAHKTKT
jgi:hypothetical protein